MAQVVEGSVRRAGTLIRIDCTLTRVADGFTQPLPRLERTLKDAGDIFVLQDAMAAAVLEKLTQRSAITKASPATKNLAAFDAYLRGRGAPALGSAGVRHAIAHFAQAVELDPGFAPAWARLAEAQLVVYEWGSADSSAALLERARGALNKALALSADLPEALLARARLARLNRDFAAARRDLQQVDALQPGMAELSYLRAFLAIDERDWPAALRHGREAITRDPKNGDWANMLAVNIFTPGGDFPMADRLFAQIQGTSLRGLNNRVALRVRWRGAAAGLKLLEALRPVADNIETETWRGLMLFDLGRLEEARAVAGRLAERLAVSTEPNFEPLQRTLHLFELTGDTASARRWAQQELRRWEAIRAEGNEMSQSMTAIVFAQLALGRSEEARQALKTWRPPPIEADDVRRMLRMAPAYARVGEVDRAVALLQAAADAGYQHGHWLRFDPALAGLRADRRFAALRADAEAHANAQPDPGEP